MTLLAPDQRNVAIVLNPGAASPFLLLGDHAGREIPTALGGLGLPADERRRHIAWDIGVAALGQHLSTALGATFIRQRFSRLVIDCNRDPARADAIPEVSDGTAVPGNRGLSAAERRARVAEVAEPYHAAIAAELDARTALGRPTTLVSLHSFTPHMDGLDRPWRFGVLHAEDSAFSRAVLARLRAQVGAGLVGDNAPYSMDDVDFTIPRHARPRGLDYLELEVRQDLIARAAGQRQVAGRLAELLPHALADAGGL
ncbi:N-formylglutamate amidohydrolase [Phenylobacterium sp.]|jgi:predicted N-formylglutamate amidohydrolase|uniref:N-formylglutamate amidohydrolase n=1 Tax=Phenylobacterium sp. TaxID=1871053 RepID=UPI002E320023|nr:N-formylglutamate amidohydrolase [Phenylobacterium sp.]HEX4710266.1 N-formylglutamate amidohydrolase [Phenylobacterium sp.]